MIFYKDGERLYLTKWDYNRCRLMTALEVIVKNAGGKVKPNHTAIVSDRNLDPDKTVEVTQAGYITFVYDGMLYSYSTDSNPFFEFHYSKTPVVDGKYSKDIYVDADETRVYVSRDDMYYSGGEVTDAEIEAKAKQLFDYLIKAPVSKKAARSKHYIQVANVYDGGYHKEAVYDKERFEKVWDAAAC